MNMSKLKCSYCNRPLRRKFSFSWPYPGIKTKYKCDRKICDWEIAIKDSTEYDSTVKSSFYYLYFLLTVLAVIFLLFKGLGYVL